MPTQGYPPIGIFSPRTERSRRPIGIASRVGTGSPFPTGAPRGGGAGERRRTIRIGRRVRKSDEKGGNPLRFRCLRERSRVRENAWSPDREPSSRRRAGACGDRSTEEGDVRSRKPGNGLRSFLTPYAEPLNLDQWVFYVIATKALDAAVGHPKAIPLSSLRQLEPLTATHGDIYQAIRRVLATGS